MSVDGAGCVVDNIVSGGGGKELLLRILSTILSIIVCDCMSLWNRRLGCDKWHFDMPDRQNEHMQSIRCCNL